jgi:RNA polymerase sigma-B factor
MHAKSLTSEPETLLLERWHARRDERARAELVRRYMPLARGLARRYSYTREPIDDLEQVASLGLVQALERFDPSVGSSFRAFAAPTIMGELRRHFRDTGWGVHLPRSLQERTRDVQSALELLQARLGHSPAISEVAEHLGLTSEQVVEAIEARAAYRLDSLDSPDDRAAWVNKGRDDPGFASSERRLTLGRAMKALTERDLTLIRLRFERDLSQTEIGREMGISQMHVSRLLRRALARMHAIVAAEVEA